MRAGMAINIIEIILPIRQQCMAIPALKESCQPAVLSIHAILLRE
jgi:hypothetical protein